MKLYIVICSGYEGMMNRLSYYRGDILCYGQNADGVWFILGTQE